MDKMAFYFLGLMVLLALLAALVLLLSFGWYRRHRWRTAQSKYGLMASDKKR